jgi:hypothetical protein
MVLLRASNLSLWAFNCVSSSFHLGEPFIYKRVRRFNIQKWDVHLPSFCLPSLKQNRPIDQRIPHMRHISDLKAGESIEEPKESFKKCKLSASIRFQGSAYCGVVADYLISNANQHHDPTSVSRTSKSSRMPKLGTWTTTNTDILAVGNLRLFCRSSR